MGTLFLVLKSGKKHIMQVFFLASVNRLLDFPILSINLLSDFSFDTAAGTDTYFGNALC